MKTLLVLLTIPTLILLAAWGDNEHAVTAATCAANPDPATPDFNQVDTPSAGDSVSSPVTVKGRILAFEATFRVTIFDANSNVLADVQGMSSDGTMLSPFEVQVPFSVAAATPACMWVYESSARDGSPINVRQIPLQLLPAGGLPVTGAGSPPDSGVPASTWAAAVLALVLGTTAITAAVKRRQVRAQFTHRPDAS